MPLVSLVRLAGGGFSRQSRFTIAKSLSTPGPDYSLPGALNQHTGTLLYKNDSETKGVGNGQPRMPNPAHSRSAWMMGTIKHDAAYFKVQHATEHTARRMSVSTGHGVMPRY
jgi:hypothetical protein